ncbi:MAG: hypothetical protein L0226_04075 [Acidobacteria bacterium]|nr:hypothetical protein [Acidobacteriota bacterium]
MTVEVINLISSRQATATVNEWLVCYVGDRYLAGEPDVDGNAELGESPFCMCIRKMILSEQPEK